MQQGVFAKLVERDLPEYPKRAASAGREGWAHVSFMVTREGEVTELILEDSGGGREFGKAALRSIRRWKYEPAMLDGEAVEQCATNVMLRFQLDTDRARRGARPAFIGRYRDVMKEMRDADLEVLEEQVDELEETARNLYEGSRVSLVRSILAQRAGDPLAELGHLRRAVAGDGEFVEQGLYGKLLVSILNLELQLHQYGRALDTFDRIEKLESKVEVPDSLEAVVRSIQRNRDEGQAFRARAEIGEADEDHHGQGVWRYKVVGRQPGIHDVEGELGKMELRCDFRRVVSRAEEGKAWRIPESWGDCWMYVFGAPGSTFSLIEHPRGSS